MKKIISVFLAVLMLAGVVFPLFSFTAVDAYADFVDKTDGSAYERATEAALYTSYASFLERCEGKVTDAEGNKTGIDKLSLVLSLGNYQLWASRYTGEVIYYNTRTGEALSTNPYDFADNDQISKSVREQLLSQIMVAYRGNDGNIKYMYSFTDAAQRGQIQMKYIKNGIRMIYSIGRENAEYLLPGWITEESFYEKIVKPARAYVEKMAEELGVDLSTVEFPTEPKATKYATYFAKDCAAAFAKQSPDYDPNVHGKALIQLGKIFAGYTYQNPNEIKNSKKRRQMQAKYPITAKKITDEEGNTRYKTIYTRDETYTDKQLVSLESFVKLYCPEYGYDDLELDHAETGYVSKEETPPLFKVSLEYTIDPTDGSLQVRLPANGFRYDETLFRLEYVSVLNYFGVGRMSTETFGEHRIAATDTLPAGVYGGNSSNSILYDGYVFFPDGAGTIFRYSDLYTKNVKAAVVWSGKVYGQDYAYYTISGQNQEVVRMPVYGVVGTSQVVETPMLDDAGNHLKNEKGEYLYDLKPIKTGYVAILEEGDAMTTLNASFGATAHNYASAYSTYCPRPKDTYDLADTISVSGNTEWTVVADRKYTGNYSTRIKMLSDSEAGRAQGLASADWLGMAKVYRDYLYANGTLSRLTETGTDIPLYIETFGTIKTTKQVLSVPVTVHDPLTSFDDVRTIYEDLVSAGISNINFKLTGYANGGMASTYPTGLKWEKNAGGSSGFSNLIAYASEKGFGIYPDFDFVYINNEKAFDGISLKSAGARAVDNRYCSKQIYDAVYQTFDSYFNMCVATNVIAKYFDQFSANLIKYTEDGSFGLSVSTLGSDLNSNFDTDNLINREEAKKDVSGVFSTVKENYKSVMTSGGNFYALPYVKHLLEMPLSASNYRYESASVPFMAMVLHGAIHYTGTALNTSGDTEYNLLKSIESGASPYYMLSYRNENILLMKRDEDFNKYYSIRYDIWRGTNDDPAGANTLIGHYRRLNAALGDLQEYLIVNHSFLKGERILKETEVAANRNQLNAAVTEALRESIAGAKNEQIERFYIGVSIYEKAKTLDGQLRSAALADELDPTGMKLSKFINGDPDAAVDSDKIGKFSEFTQEWRDVVQRAYAEGNGLEDLKVNLGYMEVCVFTENELIVPAIKAAVGSVYAQYYASADNTDPEWKALETAVRQILAEYYATYSPEYFAMYENLKAALGQTGALTKEQIITFNAYVVSGKTEAYVVAEQGTAYWNVVKYCQQNGFVFATVDGTDLAGRIGEKFNFNQTDSFAEDGYAYVRTDYTLDDEHIVMVTYEGRDGNQVRFVLNYNIFAVKVRINGINGGNPITLEPYQGIRIDGGNYRYV